LRTTATIALALGLVTMTLVPLASARHRCPADVCVLDGHEDEDTWRNRILTASEGAGTYTAGYVLATVWISQYVTDRPDWHYESTTALVSVQGGVSPLLAFTHTYANAGQTSYDRDGGDTDHERTRVTVGSDHRVDDTVVEAEVTYSQEDDHDGEGCREHLWLETQTPDGERETDLLDARPCTVQIPQLIESGARVPILALPT
jgi:hypothetical protein